MGKQTKTQTYYKEWWEKNGSKVRAKRRKKYETDEEYRERIKNATRERRLSTRTPGFPGERRGRKPGSLGPVLVEINGKKVPCITAGELAERLGVTRQTVCRWERLGIIPKVRRVSGIRRYTEQEAKVLLQAKNKAKQDLAGSYKDSVFTEAVRANWPNG